VRRPQDTVQPKALIIGLDAATFALIKPWAQAGHLPTFQRLLTEGTHGEFLSTIPPVTAPSWTSFMTGKNPGKHGLYDFIEPQPDGYEPRYANARSRFGKTLWEVLSEEGVSVGVLNVPMTYPPVPVRGYMISGLDAPDSSSAITFPPELYQELTDQFGKVSQQIRFLGYLNTDERRTALLRALADMSAHYSAMTQYLIERHPVDVVMVVFTATDTVQHFFWHYMDPAHPQYDAGAAENYRGAILQVYQQMDDIIGQLMACLPADATVALMSDHGGAPTSAREFYLNRYLAELGLLSLRRHSEIWYAPRALLQSAMKKLDVVFRKTLTPQHKERIASWFPRLRQTWEAHSSGLSQIDWQRTRAYGHEILTHPSGIWINVKGRRPQGIVQPGAEYEALVQWLMARLYELQDPLTGKQLINRVYRKEEIYHGPYLERAPDLTLEWWDGVTFIARRSFTDRATEQAIAYVGGQPITTATWSGSHTLNGILMLWGKPFQVGKQLAPSAIFDLAPTLLYVLGVPIPHDMDGRVLCEAFTEAFAAEHVVLRRQDVEGDQQHSPREETYSEAEAAQMAERLRNLGYIE